MQGEPDARSIDTLLTDIGEGTIIETVGSENSCTGDRGTAFVDWLHVDDVTSALDAAAVNLTPRERENLRSAYSGLECQSDAAAR